ncbi:PD40 domain-containing protein, partial [Flavobacteriales bacterium AH-315-E23]|nr:PD40 domain-containing protein [Flavobacteriales bacterium AH-315-E23]
MADKLVFVSERDIDLINYGETGYSTKSYLTIQYSTINNDNDTTTYSKPRLFSGRISQLQHSGPISFDDTGNFAVFTRVHYFKNGTERVYRPQLFSTRFEKNKWREIERLNINNSQYSYGHPALSSDGKRLYFVSDMEGGYGGKDIYVSENNNGSWSDPVNLGAAVNTVGNEAFPFLYKDSLFFFSSDGHPGFGGMDLHYSVLEEGQITSVSHLDSSINSSADDFGFFLNKSQSTGYFSSNRNS